MIKKFYVILLSICILCCYNPSTCSAQNNDTTNQPIAILEFNKLIAYPEYALNNKNSRHQTNDAEHLTTTEFYKILQSLYINNYVVVKLDDAYDYNTGNTKPITLPQGKKPIVILFNNLTYDTQIRSSGFVDKLIIDRTDTIATYTSRKSINDRVSYDNECITIFENFVTSNPKFCFNGARATICVNNNNGLFGYKTIKTNATSKFEIKRAIKIAKKLKTLGYTFACSGFEDDEPLTDLEFASQINTWNNQTTLITGQTNVYICKQQINTAYKKDLLASNNFNFLLTYDNSNLPIITQVNGKALRENNTLQYLFDPLNVYDHLRRTVPYISD